MITEYAGGWSDADTQRRKAAEAAREAGRVEAAARRAEAKPQEKPRVQAPQKLTFKEARELDLLPKTMEKLEAEIAKLAETMADPGLYARDPAAAQAAAERTAAARAELDAAEERWLELEEKREAIAAAKARP